MTTVAGTATPARAGSDRSADAAPPQARLGDTAGTFRLDIQGLRGIAVIIAVGYHAHLGPNGGFVGVEMFFVLSGYVITLVLLRELHRTGRLSLRNFYVRRIRRLLPVFAVFAATTTLAAIAIVPGAVIRASIADTARAASVFLANVQLERNGGGYFSPAAELNPFLHTWSLSMEEQFYLVLPGLVALTWWLGRDVVRSRRWLHRLVVATTVVSLLAAVQIVLHGDLRAAFYGTPFRVWEFGLGILLALNLARLERITRPWAIVLALAGLAMVFGSALLYHDTVSFPGPAAIPPTLGTTLLIAAGTAANPVSRAVGGAPLAWIGDRSYGWYLWHWPTLVFGRVLWPDAGWPTSLAIAVGTLALAAVTYVVVEEPVRRNRGLTGMAVLALFGIGVCGPLALATVVARDAQEALEPVEGEFGMFTEAWNLDECTNLPFDLETCTFPAPDEAGTVLVLGDSMSAAMTDVVTASAARLQLTTVVSTMFGCPVYPRGVLDGGIDKGDSCLRYQEHTLELVDELEPDIVFVTHRSPEWVRPDSGRPLLDADGEVIPTHEAALAEWQDAAATFFARVDEPILLLTTVPEFSEEVTEHIAANRNDHPDTVLTRDEVRARRGDVVAVEAAAAEADGQVLVLDPVPIMCDETCSARADGRWLYHDSHHLRAYATAVLAEPLTDAMEELLTGLATGGNH